MNRTFARYRTVGHRFVSGWVQPEVLTIVAALDAAQRDNGVVGSVVEIGVHRGKFLIALQLLQRHAGASVAIDVFGDQQLNVDKSGRGDLNFFLANVDRWSSRTGLVVHQGDSTKLSADALVALAGSTVRMFSVDGGHTAKTVLSDMRLAEASLAEGGVVIADDVFNGEWPDVAVGTLRYLDQGGKLAPFAIGFNKTLFAAPEYCNKYRDVVQVLFDRRMLVDVLTSVYNGHDVVVLRRVPRTPLEILRHIGWVRSLYHRVTDRRT
jgi:Methyltransferase domain